ncbi:hypothetical protein Ancab_020292 [Ancistrocladus abbreviatus]
MQYNQPNITTIDSEHFRDSGFRLSPPESCPESCSESSEMVEYYLTPQEDTDDNDCSPETDDGGEGEELVEPISEDEQNVCTLVPVKEKRSRAIRILRRSKKKKKALVKFRRKLEDAIEGKYLLQKSHLDSDGQEGGIGEENLREISLWGVPLLPSKGHEGTDIILLKFLKAKDWRVSEAFEMLRKTLIWRKEYKVDGIHEEELGGNELADVVFVKSTDRGGHPVCYNVYGGFRDKELCAKTFGTEDNLKGFLRWRVQVMEKSIKELSFKAGGVDSFLQITDLKNSPGPGTKGVGPASEAAVTLFQKHYPELIYKNSQVTVVWDLMVVGSEVTYKEEFVPDDEGSYSILLQKEKKIAGSTRNSFYINEPGKIVISMRNASFHRRRVFCRYKCKVTLPVYVVHKQQSNDSFSGTSPE